jgi:hypothetical protein
MHRLPFCLETLEDAAYFTTDGTTIKRICEWCEVRTWFSEALINSIMEFVNAPPDNIACFLRRHMFPFSRNESHGTPVFGHMFLTFLAGYGDSTELQECVPK